MASKTERFEMRFDRETIELVDQWRREQPGSPSRVQAIRHLVEMALQSDKLVVKPPQEGSPSAHSLAGRELDKLADPTASVDEQAQRKKRLLKGPEEFRGLMATARKKRRGG